MNNNINQYLDFEEDKRRPRMANENCHIKGQEDDLSCRPNGETTDKLWLLASDVVGLGAVLIVYRYVSQ